MSLQSLGLSTHPSHQHPLTLPPPPPQTTPSPTTDSPFHLPPPPPLPNALTNNVRPGSSLDCKHSGGELKKGLTTPQGKHNVTHFQGECGACRPGGGGRRRPRRITADSRFACFGKLLRAFTKWGKEIGNRSGSCSSVFATSRFGVNHAVTAADRICLRCIRAARLRVETDTAGR